MMGLLLAAMITYVPSGKVAALDSAGHTCFNVTPALLAGEAQTESSMGTDNGPSSAGADGPFQFEPGTWGEFGNGGNVWNWGDAAQGAANALGHYSREFARLGSLPGMSVNASKDAYAECAYYAGP